MFKKEKQSNSLYPYRFNKWESSNVSLKVLHVCVCVHACTHSCPTLCNSMDCSLPGSSVQGISQARILEQVAISSSGDLPDSGIQPMSPILAGRFFTNEPSGKSLKVLIYHQLFWIYICLINICPNIDTLILALKNRDQKTKQKDSND